MVKEKKSGGKEAPEPKKPAEEVTESSGKERSYKARIIFSEKNFTIDIPVRWNKLSSKEVDEAYPIIFRDPKGVEVRKKSWVEDNVVETEEDAKEGWFQCNNKVHMRKAWTNPKGEEISDEVTAFQVVGGKENAVEKCKKTEDFKVIALKDMAEYDDWQPEDSMGLYKIFTETPQDTYALGQFVKKYLVDGNKFAAIKISVSSNGYKEYYGLIKPILKGKNQYGLTMKISRIKIDWDKGGLMEFMDVKPPEETPKTKPKSVLDAI